MTKHGAASALLLALAPAAGFAGGCAGGADAGGDSRSSALVYGADDRREYFELAADDERALVSGSMVALLSRAALRVTGSEIAIDAPSWGEAGGLCAGEAFADQPAAAFCSGVLVDWDLVLTAGHCLRLLALDDFAVVFGYLYDAPDHLAVTAKDLATPVEIVDEALDPEGDTPRLDYAWVRLAHPVSPSRRPAPIRVHAPLAAGDAIVSIATGSGLPLKWDGGGRVGDARAKIGDYFTASTDTFAGSSGGGAFDTSLALVGVMARGSADLATTDEGCARVVQVPDGSSAAEQFTYAGRALQRLCAAHPEASTLCRASCGDPCQALPPPPEAAGCSIAAVNARTWPGLGALLLLIFLTRARVGATVATCRRERRE